MSTSIHNNDFYQVQGWMINNLHLKGIDLVVFAIIFGFTKNPKAGIFYGSLDYFCQWTGVERHTITRALNRLVESNLITKSEICRMTLDGPKKHSTYLVNYEQINQLLEISNVNEVN